MAALDTATRLFEASPSVSSYRGEVQEADDNPAKRCGYTRVCATPNDTDADDPEVLQVHYVNDVGDVQVLHLTKKECSMYSLTVTNESTLENPAFLGSDERDAWIWEEIGRSGPQGVVERLMGQPDGDVLASNDDESVDDPESEPHETGGYPRLFQYLLSILDAYNDDWNRGLDAIKSSTELSTEKASILLTLLDDDREVFTTIVFLAVKFRRMPSKLFDALSMCKRVVQFLYYNIERYMECRDARLYGEAEFVLQIARELLSRHQALQENKENQPVTTERYSQLAVSMSPTKQSLSTAIRPGEETG